MRKYPAKKNEPKKTGAYCLNLKCNKKLTTADTLYSLTAGYCFKCNGAQ
jgi:hypothetical protein